MKRGTTVVEALLALVLGLMVIELVLGLIARDWAVRAGEAQAHTPIGAGL